jgi:hypothetical protein
VTATTLYEAASATRSIDVFWTSNDGREQWLTICSRGYCPGVGAGTPDAQNTIYHSGDGGVTWTEVETLEASAAIVGATGEGAVLARSPIEPVDGRYPVTYSIYPDGPLIEPPVEDARYHFPQGGPDILWQSADTLSVLHDDGTTAFEASDEVARRIGAGFLSLVGPQRPDGRAFVITWLEGPTERPAHYSALVVDGEVVGLFRAAPDTTIPAVGAWLSGTLALGNAYIRPEDIGSNAPAPPFGGVQAPVLIDFEKGEITPVLLYGPNLFGTEYDGRNRVVAVEQASFFVVNAGEDCLNLRKEPSLSAVVVGCYSNGVLLRGAPKETETIDGVTWGAMEAPDGTDGWASMEFLVR